MQDYLQKLLEGTKPLWAALLAALCYVLFPQRIYMTGFFIVAGTIIFDTITKMQAISIECGGYVKARKAKRLISRLWWAGLFKKLQTLFYVSILAGLSYRLSPLSEAGIFLATFAYAMMFLREAQSVLENMDDAGHDVGWFLVFVKKKQTDLMDRRSPDIAVQLHMPTDIDPIDQREGSGLSGHY